MTLRIEPRQQPSAPVFIPRQDDKPGPACYRRRMGWSITAALVVGFLALVAVFVLRAKRHDAGSAPGRFDFDRYKEGELSQRGLG